MNTRFKLYTLVDITQTNARRGDDVFNWNQQQNFLTVLQTIGMRVNPTVEKQPELVKDFPKFGSKYKDAKQAWCLDFAIEYQGAIDIEMLNSDFDLVPFISNLNEQVKFKNSVFRTSGTETNIVFVEIA